jgi:predicted DNA-binding transcriptional regulator YafY
MLSILFALQGGAALTVRELAARLEVSARTVTRDLEALASSGVPVYAERGYGGGWRLSEGFRARFNGLKRDDVERLLLSQSGAARLFADLGREREFQDTWERLLQAASSGTGVDANAVRERIHIDGAGWRESFDRLPLLPALYDAVWSDRKVRMRYGEDEAERELLPYGLVAKGNVWYVVGMTGGALRTYRVSRVAALRREEETFDRPEGFDLEAYWASSIREFRERLPVLPVRLRLTKDALDRLRRLRFADVGSVAEEGDRFVAEANLQTIEYAVDCLLRLGGEGAELLGPPELRDAMRAAVRRLADAYGA